VVKQSKKVKRFISIGQLNVLLQLHTQPIKQLVLLLPSGKVNLEDDILFTMNGLRNSQITGVNIGEKYQKEGLNLLDSFSDEVRECGFITSIKIEDKKLYGYITTGEAINSLIEKENIIIFGVSYLTKSILWHIKDRSRVTLVENSIEKTLEISNLYPEVSIKFSNSTHPFKVSDNSTLIDVSEDDKFQLNFLGKDIQRVFIRPSSFLKVGCDLSIIDKLRERESLLDIKEWF
jgi:shikimate 5-dehydrogenase